MRRVLVKLIKIPNEDGLDDTQSGSDKALDKRRIGGGGVGSRELAQKEKPRLPSGLEKSAIVLLSFLGLRFGRSETNLACLADISSHPPTGVHSGFCICLMQPRNVFEFLTLPRPSPLVSLVLPPSSFARAL
jgi:hypothetical protein